MGIHEANPHFIHHQAGTPRSSLIREAIFGIEDGMVSTVGAITGIAAGSHDHFIVVLAGLVIISVESLSMAVGSFLSSKSEREIEERKLHEETIELKNFPREEEEELVGMYIKEGWPKELAQSMAKVASQNHELFLREMAHLELKIIPDTIEKPLHNAFAMGFTYIIGGSVAIAPYLLIKNLARATPISIVGTLVGLFVVGAATTKYSKRSWWRSGLEILTLAGLAAAMGYGVGQAVDYFWLRRS